MWIRCSVVTYSAIGVTFRVLTCCTSGFSVLECFLVVVLTSVLMLVLIAVGVSVVTLLGARGELLLNPQRLTPLIAR